MAGTVRSQCPRVTGLLSLVMEMFWNQTVEMVAPTPEHTATMEIKCTSLCVNSISMKLLCKTKEQARGSHSNGVKGMAEWDVQSRFFPEGSAHAHNTEPQGPSGPHSGSPMVRALRLGNQITGTCSQNQRLPHSSTSGYETLCNSKPSAKTSLRKRNILPNPVRDLRPTRALKTSLCSFSFSVLI